MILITTRNSFKKDLEDAFQTISFNLNNFETEDQLNFLVKYWHKQDESLDETKLKRSAEELIAKIKSSLTENISQLIGIPLQTKMMADIFLNKLNLANIEFNSIADLYHEFVEMKFNIQFEEKNNFEIARDEDFYEKEKKKFYEDHIQLSLMILFKENESELLFNGIDQKRILKFGFIVSFGNKNLTPTFLHQSYAEYFVAKRAINKLEQSKENTHHDEELDKILQNEEFFLVRKFLNDLLSFKVDEQQQNSKVRKSKTRSKTLLFFRILCCSKNKLNKVANLIFFGFLFDVENCCRENLANILIYLIEIKNLTAIHLNNDYTKNSLLKSLGAIKFQSEKANKISKIITRSNFKTDSNAQIADVVKYIEQYIEIYSDIYPRSELEFKINNLSAVLVKKFSVLDMSVVLDDLISNSEKAGATLIEIEMSNTSGGILKILFSDNGIGITEQFLKDEKSMEKIFDLGITTTKGGSGIGMNLVREGLKSMNGTIKLLGNNLKLSGACFEIEIK